MRRRDGQAAIAAGTAVLGSLFYYYLLNVPPTLQIPTVALPSPNGYDALVAAAKLKVQDGAVADSIARVRYKEQRVYSPTEQEAIVAANARALAATREALKLPFSNPQERSPATASFKEFAKFRGLARLMSLEAQVKAARGDAAGAVSSLLDIDDLGLKIPRGGVLIAGLVGIACESIGDSPMWNQIDRLDGPSALAAARRLETLTAQRFPFSKTLEEEKWFGETSFVQELNDNSTVGLIRKYTKDGQASETGDNVDDTDHPLTASQKLTIWRQFLTHSKRRIFADYLATMDACAAKADLPYSASAAEIPVPDDPINQATAPIFSQARFKDSQIRMQSSLLVCALALRSYQASHGSYPASLADLVKDGLIERMPDDPFANAFGTAFGYRRVGTDKYLLYSVGPDGVDDGGRPVDLTKTNNPARYYPNADDKGDWVVGVDVGRPQINTAQH